CLIVHNLDARHNDQERKRRAPQYRAIRRMAAVHVALMDVVEDAEEEVLPAAQRGELDGITADQEHEAVAAFCDDAGHHSPSAGFPSFAARRGGTLPLAPPSPSRF